MNTVKEFWSAFTAASGVPEVTAYQVWHFGNTAEMARELADLVISGKKTATCSLAAVNEIKPEDAPVLDGYSVVTDFDGRPMCIIRTTDVRHVPFNEVDAQFAANEGEGDRSLDYWRKAHIDYFEQGAWQLGVEFRESSTVCCERFELVYPR